MGIEPFLHTETPGNPLTTPAVLHNRGPQVDSDASDQNAKRHKRLHARNVDGQFQFEIRNESSEVEGVGQSQYGDENAIMETTKKDVMRAIQTAMETVKKHLMIQTYEFGNYP